MNDYAFYSISQLKIKNSVGNRLIKILAKLYPDTFSSIFDRVVIKTDCNAEFSGLFVKYVDGKVVCVSVIMNGLKLDRIFTLPLYRKKSYATEMLKLLKGISLFSAFTFLSPVDTSIIHLFKNAKWVTYDATKINKDGTVDMLSAPSLYKDITSIPMWFAPFQY